jgi:hypothetical protein
MSMNDQPLFFAREVRDGHPFWEIATTRDAPGGLQMFHTKNRFWMHEAGSAFGFSFISVEGRHAVRAFRAVLPTAANPGEVDLAELARSGTADPEKFVVLASKVPERGPDGRLVLKFGDVYVIASVKNFVVLNEQNATLFMIYRSSAATCTVQAREPVTPIMAFAWAIAIITKE